MIKRIYWAAPLFTDEQREYNAKCVAKLESMGFEVYLPQRDTGLKTSGETDDIIYAKDIIGLQGCDAVVAVFGGFDSGTMFELGYANRMDKKLFGIGECLNCMFLHVEKYPSFEDLLVPLEKASLQLIQLPQVMWVWDGDERTTVKQKALVVHIANESDLLTHKELVGDDTWIRKYPVIATTDNFEYCAVIDEG